LLIFIVGFAIIGLSFRIKNPRIKRHLFLGAMFICLRSLIAIPLEEYELTTHALHLTYWIPVIFIGFLGFLFLLLAFKEVIK